MDGSSFLSDWRSPKTVALFLGMLLLAGVVVVSIVRERIVSEQQWQVAVTGQGKVAYQADIAMVTLGVQVDKVPTADQALKNLNAKMNKVVAAIKATGISPDDVQTQNYTLAPQYNYKDGVTTPAGYSANQQLVVKVRKINQGSEQLTRVLADATKAGANQVNGIAFDLSNINEVKQQARLKAIADAKGKARQLAWAAGVRLGRVVGWWENVVQAPGVSGPAFMADGKGGGDMPQITPTVPSGLQEVIIEVSLNYKLR